jgi:hypothetical protein
MKVFILLLTTCEELAHEGMDGTEIIGVFSSKDIALEKIKKDYKKFKYQPGQDVFGTYYPESWVYRNKPHYITCTLTIAEHEVDG